MSLLGTTVLLSVTSLNDENYTVQNNGSPVASALVVGEDVEGGTVNVRVFLDGPNTLRVQNYPIDAVEAVTAASTTSSK